MNDLLGVVKGRGDEAGAPPQPPPGPRSTAYDVEAGFTAAPGQREDIDAFFARVEEIKGDMAQVKSLEGDIERMHEEGKSIVRSKEMQEQRRAMQVGTGL